MCKLCNAMRTFHTGALIFLTDNCHFGKSPVISILGCLFNTFEKTHPFPFFVMLIHHWLTAHAHSPSTCIVQFLTSELLLFQVQTFILTSWNKQMRFAIGKLTSNYNELKLNFIGILKRFNGILFMHPIKFFVILDNFRIDNRQFFNFPLFWSFLTSFLFGHTFCASNKFVFFLFQMEFTRKIK